MQGSIRVVPLYGTTTEWAGELRQMKKALLAISSGLAGAAFVSAGIRFSFLSWVVDFPGWLVNQVLPINFHEGEGAFGFLLSILLSWFLSSAVAWSLVVVVQRIAARSRTRALPYSRSK